ncbi:MAG: Fic family protein [Nitrospinae bacterium]|nr:Fic family protein [Nitrospinota bacterium]
MSQSDRAGKYRMQLEGYKAFIPEPLPPKPSIKMSTDLSLLLSEADQALARLDGVASILPNPDFFVAMYVRYEAVLSSQIEGTQSSLDDLLKFEVSDRKQKPIYDVDEVYNHVSAINYGLERIKNLPLSLRLLREIHEKLMKDVRGQEKTPGEFRRRQNWIGPANCTINDAIFVPPPVQEMHQMLDNLEKFLHQKRIYPVLIHCGLIHAQFETIHPFLDGNGRVGRLLITFLLCQREILQRPLLYLSHYFKKHKIEYYDRLMAVRNTGDWEGWLEFFLKGVLEVSKQAKDTAHKIIDMQKVQRELIRKEMKNNTYAFHLHDYLFRKPFLNSQLARNALQCSPATSIKLLSKFTELGLLKEVTGSQRYRIYRFSPYLELFDSKI